MTLATSLGWAERFADVFGMQLQSDPQGVSVHLVDPGTQAEERGIQVGDRIVELNGREVTESWDLMSRIDGLGPRLRLKTVRGEETRRATLRRPDLPGKLVFRSDRSGPWELWRMNADGSDLRQLTTRGLNPQGAMWSPDGKWIAFECEAPYWDIWMMDEDGGHLRQLTSFPDAETRPRWSADGKYVYFLSYQWGGTAIGRVSLASGEQQQVVRISDTPGYAPWRFPVYDLSPDGKRIAFPLQTPQGWRLHFADPDGSNVRAAAFEGEQYAIDWSPSGHRLLWAVGQAYRHFDYETEAIADFALGERAWAMFAPNSDSVIFDAPPRDGEKRDLYVADLNGKTQYRLTYHPANDQWADWWAPRD
jgi:Tol biopolymer transport system component